VHEDTRQLHQNLDIVDLHADSLLWRRDLLRRAEYGHVDLPRLVEGNVALQVFAAVTKVPRGLNFERNPADSDLLPLLTALQAWPFRTWFSPYQRALYQAEKLHRLATRSSGSLTVIKSARDLGLLLERRAVDRELVGGLLALEGAHALEGNLDNLDRLHNAGYRMVGLTHFFDNEAAGSAHGMVKGGLTALGRELVRRVQKKRMLLDLAHAAPRTIDDVLPLLEGPVVVSHTGVRGTCESPRNLSDDHLREIASGGGIIGIALFEGAVGGPTIEHTVRALRYTCDLIGVDHVAVGSDFDGSVTTPIDVSQMVHLTQSLLDRGFCEAEITKIMGGNAIRVMDQVLSQD
jgi:microsomal dipeptidase-like Zn-dependent dipeptidase